MSESDTPPSNVSDYLTAMESCDSSTDPTSTQAAASGWSQDGDLLGCDQLERRWLLWHAFMKEHAHLDAWLQLAEQAVCSQNWTQVTYASAKEDLRRFERLRCEAGTRLVQLDGLTHKNRMLTRLFKGAMRARLLVAARECGQRWDDVNVKLESITGRLTNFVCLWEEFEAEREELALWLAELEVRLLDVQQLTGSTCEKLAQLQAFQECVCVNSGRVSGLLKRGEGLIQLCEPSDAQRVERHLLELLRSCSHVYNNIGRTHMRLLSMKLVFEDDFMLTPPPDSGCPSEMLFEEEGSPLDLPVSLKDRHPPPPPSSPPSPSHEHLEWDPSVDVGRSVSCSGDSYFNACTGGWYQDADEMMSLVTSCLSWLAGECNTRLKRRSYISSLNSDISNDAINQEAEMDLNAAHHHWNHWVTSTPEDQDGEAVGFDGRVRAWLGGQSPSPPSCCKAVQTDGQFSVADKPAVHALSGVAEIPRCQDDTSRVSNSWPHWTRERRQSRTDDHDEEEEKGSCCDEAEHLLPQQSRAPRAPPFPALICLLLAAVVSLLACLLWNFLEPPCRRGMSRTQRNFHLSYVNGAPPT
ncbi:nesprin-2 isoform X2 [Dunckerocampus dactyliophorus]|uniref:nesprin-2 isoform X2 n=1 Tax=Dunckerocampus dactyliophorus TaxID=161453 RepID=UPI0024066B6A|nr:nesprin-2 isoform X2 [Dunckerocampus dactyliophorus]